MDIDVIRAYRTIERHGFDGVGIKEIEYIKDSINKARENFYLKEYNFEVGQEVYYRWTSSVAGGVYIDKTIITGFSKKDNKVFITHNTKTNPRNVFKIDYPIEMYIFTKPLEEPEKNNLTKIINMKKKNESIRYRIEKCPCCNRPVWCTLKREGHKVFALNRTQKED